jgi:hypothetical protein
MPVFENVLPAGADTILTISSFGNMLYQARKLTQTLQPIGEAAKMERTINGTLVDISVAQFRKYTTSIRVPSEVNAPPIDNVFPGQTVTVQCAVSLSFVTGAPGLPHKPVVSGSEYTEGAYTFYRPELVMMVKGVSTQFDEWDNVVGWNIELEEI